MESTTQSNQENIHEAIEIKRNPTSNDNAPTPVNTPATNLLQNLMSNKTNNTALSREQAAIIAQNPQVMAALQDKLGELIGAESGYVSTLPKEVKRRVKALNGLHLEAVKLDAEFHRQVLALEKQFLVKKAPLFSRRKEIVTGTAEVTDQEVDAGYLSEDEESEDQQSGQVKGIPEFWLTAIKSCEDLEQVVFETDWPALESLVDIRVSHLTDNAGFRLEFEFTENDYFTDKVLSKEYYLEENEDGTNDSLVYDYAVGTEISWKQGKCLTQTVEQRKQRHKGTNKTRVVKKVVKLESFFNFFSPPEVPDEDDEDEEEIGELLRNDYEIGELFKDEIIPKAVAWFTGEAAEGFGGGDYDDEDDEEDEEDDLEAIDEEQSDDEDDDNEEGGPQQPGQKKEECKQQ